MKVLYIDAFSGVSGDKMVASLLALGMDINYLKQQLSTLNIENEYSLELTNKNVMGIEAFYFKVNLNYETKHQSNNKIHYELYDQSQSHKHENNQSHSHDHHQHDLHNHNDKNHSNKNHNSDHHHIDHFHRNLKDIKDLINNSLISKKAKKTSCGIFEIVAQAEAKIHGKSINEVHFHEVGAIDSIIDIVSTGILIDKLEIDEVYTSKIPLGNGFVKCQHGLFPVPAPATSEILVNVPVYKTEIDGELTTPTGAAIVKYLTKEFNKNISLNVSKIGYGAGTKEFPIPNVLRLEIGEIILSDSSYDKIVKLETNIDDSTPENIAFLSEKLFENKALDVFSTPIFMKKGRLATLLTVLCYEKHRIILEKLIFSNSSTFGIRRINMDRTILKREIDTIKIEGVDIHIKSGFLEGEKMQKSLEYEDVKKLSLKLGLSYNETIELILRNI